MKAMPEAPFHLTVEIVREIHAEAIEAFGGSTGVREPRLLESAVAAPQATVRGKSPYVDLAEMAAAYLFYLCRNQPFIDGNKRAALGACLVFLRLNGLEPKAVGREWEELSLAVAASEIDREEATVRLRHLLPKRRSPAPLADPAYGSSRTGNAERDPGLRGVAGRGECPPPLTAARAGRPGGG